MEQVQEKKLVERFSDEDDFRWYIHPETGEKLPSVTTILGQTVLNKKLESWYQNTPRKKIEEVRTNAANHGTAVHAYIEQILSQPKFDWDIVLPEHRQSVASFVQFARLHKITATKVEETLYSNTHGYAGSVDFIGHIDGELVIADWKITKSYKITNGWQLGAYRLAWMEANPGQEIGLAGLQINRMTGEPKLFKYEHLDFVSNAFLHSLQVFKALYFNKLQKLEYKWLKHDPFAAATGSKPVQPST